LNESPQLQALLALVGVGVFSLVWIGLAASVRKISQRQHNAPSFNVLLNAAHMSRFAGWAVVGAVALRGDFWTGFMLITTRVPAVALVAITFLQRKHLRPSLLQVLSVVLPTVGVLAFVCFLVTLRDTEYAAVPVVFGIALPAATPLEYAANLFVLACFAVQIFYALPQQIAEARVQPLGKLRWFQLSMLANYGFTLGYSFWVQDELIRVVMRSAYSLVFIEQAIFVALIERAIRARRRTTETQP
jgi:hypothetical protein